MAEIIFTFLMLVALQSVLGIDNLLYISLESQKAPKEKQSYVRKMGILIAIGMRIGLLFLLISLIKVFQDPLFEFRTNFIDGSFTGHSLIVLLGGGFIIYTAMKEIIHLLAHNDSHGVEGKKKSLWNVIFWIVLMNLIFSFDSILSAMALTDNFWIMAATIVTSGLIMMWLSDRVSAFLQKNRMFEIVGLFILFIVGIMLLTEGGHLAHMHLFGEPITQMNQTTFYFILAVIIIIEIIQTKYQKKLNKNGNS